MAESSLSSGSADEAMPEPIPRTKKAAMANSAQPEAVHKHPTTAAMVTEAIVELSQRGGSSLHAIKKYVAETYQLDSEKYATYIKKYIKTAVDSGDLVQTKGIGATGSFKIARKKTASKQKTTKSQTTVPEDDSFPVEETIPKKRTAAKKAESREVPSTTKNSTVPKKTVSNKRTSAKESESVKSSSSSRKPDSPKKVMKKASSTSVPKSRSSKTEVTKESTTKSPTKIKNMIKSSKAKPKSKKIVAES